MADDDEGGMRERTRVGARGSTGPLPTNETAWGQRAAGRAAPGAEARRGDDQGWVGPDAGAVDVAVPGVSGARAAASWADDRVEAHAGVEGVAGVGVALGDGEAGASVQLLGVGIAGVVTADGREGEARAAAGGWELGGAWAFTTEARVVGLPAGRARLEVSRVRRADGSAGMEDALLAGEAGAEMREAWAVEVSDHDLLLAGLRPPEEGEVVAVAREALARLPAGATPPAAGTLMPGEQRTASRTGVVGGGVASAARGAAARAAGEASVRERREISADGEDRVVVEASWSTAVGVGAGTSGVAVHGAAEASARVRLSFRAGDARIVPTVARLEGAAGPPDLVRVADDPALADAVIGRGGGARTEVALAGGVAVAGVGVGASAGGAAEVAHDQGREARGRFASAQAEGVARGAVTVGVRSGAELGRGASVAVACREAEITCEGALAAVQQARSPAEVAALRRQPGVAAHLSAWSQTSARAAEEGVGDGGLFGVGERAEVVATLGRSGMAGGQGGVAVAEVTAARTAEARLLGLGGARGAGVEAQVSGGSAEGALWQEADGVRQRLRLDAAAMGRLVAAASRGWRAVGEAHGVAPEGLDAWDALGEALRSPEVPPALAGVAGAAQAARWVALGEAIADVRGAESALWAVIGREAVREGALAAWRGASDAVVARFEGLPGRVEAAEVRGWAEPALARDVEAAARDVEAHAASAVARVSMARAVAGWRERVTSLDAGRFGASAVQDGPSLAEVVAVLEAAREGLAALARRYARGWGPRSAGVEEARALDEALALAREARAAQRDAHEAWVIAALHARARPPDLHPPDLRPPDLRLPAAEVLAWAAEVRGYVLGPLREALSHGG